MNAADIATALGAPRRQGAWWSCRCPAHDDRSPSLSIRDGDRGLIVKCWGGCEARDVLAELRRRGMILDKTIRSSPRSNRAEIVRRREAEARDVADRKGRAQKIWDGATNAYGTPVATYLAGRGINLAPPLCLRWDQFCWHGNAQDWLPAMIAAITDVNDEFTGLHRTYIRPDGAGKSNADPAKSMLGCAAGGAVRLAPAAETLLVGEGIETSMAAMQATGTPAWAALSTSGLMSLVLPALVREIVILVDNDISGAGECAARRAAERWLAEGRRVRIAMPPTPGTDMADVLIGRTPRPDEVRHVAA